MITRSPVPRLAALLGVAMLLTACPGRAEQAQAPSTPGSSIATPDGASLPPVPAPSGQTLGPDQPPLIWVGGTLTRVTDRSLVLREGLGSEVRLTRLARDATSFYRVAGGRWERLAPASTVGAEEPACIEALMDGSTLLALRVFLGADCGPV